MTLWEMFEEIGKTIGKSAMVVSARYNARLTQDEKKHLRIRYGVDDGEGLRVVEKVANQMGLSREQASSNEKRIFAKLREEP